MSFFERGWVDSVFAQVSMLGVGATHRAIEALLLDKFTIDVNSIFVFSHGGSVGVCVRE